MSDVNDGQDPPFTILWQKSKCHWNVGCSKSGGHSSIPILPRKYVSVSRFGAKLRFLKASER